MNNIAFRDMLFIMLFGFVFLVVAMLPHLNPPADEDNAEPPGNVIAAITWPAGDTDVDLWVTGPGEIVPVGYSNKGGLLWNLLRDDLGAAPDATGLNYENAYTRGITPGEYIINVHCYRCPVMPVPVVVEISVKGDGPGKKAMKIIATTTVQLESLGEELTALRFELTKDGTLVPGTMNHVFQGLRSADADAGDMSGNPADRPPGRLGGVSAPMGYSGKMGGSL